MYRCPKCNSKLEVVISNSVHLDKCLECGGIWFDREELKSALYKDIHPLLDELVDNLDSEFNKKTGECPLCNIELETKTFFDNFKLESCKSCNGIWLDKGELKYLKSMKQESLDELLNALNK